MDSSLKTIKNHKARERQVYILWILILFLKKVLPIPFRVLSSAYLILICIFCPSYLITILTRTAQPKESFLHVYISPFI